MKNRYEGLMRFYTKIVKPGIMRIENKTSIVRGIGTHLFFCINEYHTFWRNKKNGDSLRKWYMLALEKILLSPIMRKYGGSFVGNGSKYLICFMEHKKLKEEKQKNGNEQELKEGAIKHASQVTVCGLELSSAYSSFCEMFKGPKSCSISAEDGEFFIRHTPSGETKKKPPCGIVRMPSSDSKEITRAYGYIEGIRELNQKKVEFLQKGNFVVFEISETLFRVLGESLGKLFRFEQTLFKNKILCVGYVTTVFHSMLLFPKMEMDVQIKKSIEEVINEQSD